MATKETTGRVAMKLSRALGFRDRAAFIRFASDATVGHWAEVIDAMKSELRREGRSTTDGSAATPEASK